MLSRLFRLVLLLTFLGAAPAVWASPLDQAEQLIQSGDLDAALAVLDAYQPTTIEDEERSLWARAVAYSQQNRPRAALPQLERLVTLKPASARYRLNLAAVLAEVGQDDRARYHYELLRGSTDAPEITNTLDQHIDALDRRRSWEGHFNFAIVPESNAGKRTAAETIVIGGLPFVINPNARAKAATGARVGFGGAWLPWVAPNTRARLGLSFDGSVYQDGAAPRDITLAAQMGLLNFGDRGRRISGTLHIAQRWLNDTAYTTTTGLSLGYVKNIGAAGVVSVNARHQQIAFDQVGLPSVRETLLMGRYTHNLSPQFQLYVGGAVEGRTSSSATEAGQRAELSFGGQYLFQGGLQVGLDLQAGRMERDGITPLFGLTREDTTRSATIRIMNRNWSLSGFAPVLELGFEQRKSNIAIYSYDNQRVSLGLTRRF